MITGTFEAYVASLSQLSNPFDPTVSSVESEDIRRTASGLAKLAHVDRLTLAAFINDEPDAVPVIGLAVGLTREKLKNVLKHKLDSSGWTTLARQRPDKVIEMLDEDYEVVRLIDEQRTQSYDFGDILVARAGTRRTATDASATGRRVEDEIEKVSNDIGLTSVTRTRNVDVRRRQPSGMAISASTARATSASLAYGPRFTDAMRPSRSIRYVVGNVTIR